MSGDQSNGVPADAGNPARPILDTLLTAALAPDHWPAALRSIGRYVGCDEVVVFGSTGSDARDGFVWASDHLPLRTPWDATPDDETIRRRHHFPRDREGVFAALCVGDDAPDPPAEASTALPLNTPCRRCPDYRDSCWRSARPSDPLKLPHALLGAFSLRRDASSAQAVRVRLGTVLPYVEHALRVAFRMARERFALESAAIMFEHIGDGVILCDSAGRVLHRNAKAARIVARADGLHVLPGERLAGETTLDTARISQAIEACQRADDSATDPARRIIQVSRGSSRPPYVLRVSALSRDHPFARLPLGAAIAITLQDPEAASGSLDEPLRLAFAMTRAEARVVNGLLDGLTTQEMAERFGTSVHTVKSQLKSIYAKTDLHRQSDLIRLCMRLQSALH
ncbi:MAG: LuxR C-terminal-related transcriptional regulator [Burkholderiales bacterium]